MKKLTIGLAIISCFFIFITSSYAGQYEAKVTKIVNYETGRVVVTINPADGETGFTGPARIDFYTTDPSGNAMLAMVLTSVSIGTDLIVNCDSIPVSSPIYTATSFGFVAQ